MCACPAIALATAGLWVITPRQLTVKSACSVERNPCPNIILLTLCVLIERSELARENVLAFILGAEFNYTTLFCGMGFENNQIPQCI